ncbi:nucleotide-diphospho-sugar transferase [Gorgonomyces haynaldii]|nr:nucleotide-diphospho-sugar transferase [Gorgonomyces haynaldii]
MALKAIILVGGPSVGTRFRPLSMDCPKPLFPIAGSPTIYHHVQALAKVPNMKEILLIGFFEQHVFDRFLTEAQIEFPFISFRYLREYQSMGTAGGLHHFRDEIMRGNPEAFFVMNADIASSFPLDQMLKAHRLKRGVATIMTYRVPKEQSLKYGCLVFDENQKVQHFVEKPESFVSDTVSCGVYLFESSLFDFIAQAIAAKEAVAAELGMDLTQFSNMSLASSNAALSRADRPPVHLETDVLRNLIASEKGLFAFLCDRHQFWMAVKTGSSTIEANRKYLQHFLQAAPRRLSTPLARAGSIKGAASATRLIAPVYLHPTAVIHPSARIGPNVSVGPRALIGRGVRLREAIILDNVEVKNDACITSAVVGWESKIGAWSRIEGGIEASDAHEATTEKGYKRPTAAILGKGVTVNDELIIRDCIVLPHKELKSSFHREIIM